MANPDPWRPSQSIETVWQRETRSGPITNSRLRPSGELLWFRIVASAGIVGTIILIFAKNF